MRGQCGSRGFEGTAGRETCCSNRTGGYFPLSAISVTPLRAQPSPGLQLNYLLSPPMCPRWSELLWSWQTPTDPISAGLRDGIVFPLTSFDRKVGICPLCLVPGAPFSSPELFWGAEGSGLCPRSSSGCVNTAAFCKLNLLLFLSLKRS